MRHRINTFTQTLICGGLTAALFISGCDKKQNDDDLLIVPKAEGPQRLRDIAEGTSKVNLDKEGEEISPEVVKAKLMAQIQQAHDRATRQQEEAQKPGNKSKKNKTEPMFRTTKGNAVLNFNESAKKKHSDDSDRYGGIQPLGDSGDTSNSLNGSRPTQVRGAAEFNRTEQKRSVMDRIFGRNKPAAAHARQLAPGEAVSLDGSEFKAPKDKKAPPVVVVKTNDEGTVARRVEAELARKRLKNNAEYIEAKAETLAAGPDSKAELVEVEPPKAAIASDEALAQFADPGPAKLKVDPSAPPTEAQVRAAAEADYREGLEARDMIARHEAYQFAAMQRRRDAIPYLINEILHNDNLASYAARYLGIIGGVPHEGEEALLVGLQSRDGNLRQMAAESLGRIRLRRAQAPLVAALKIDRNYLCRTAYVQALGFIGDREIIPALKVVLNMKSEVEFVKISAALSLARLGDPAGRAHLIRTLDSSEPALQVLGLNGLVQLNDGDVPGYLNSALESQWDEVWNTAISLFPRLGPEAALPMLRTRLNTSNDTLRRRVAMAIGMLGSDEALPYIERSVRAGPLAERVLGCDVLGHLGRTDKAPLLIDKLQDPHQNVRQAAAIALTKINATEAIPALLEASRGWPKKPTPFLKPSMPDPAERLLLLSCVRSLRGETEQLVITSLPEKDQSWPEVETALSSQQTDFLKMYVPMELLLNGGKPAGVMIRIPSGKDVLFMQGEMVASGFKIAAINPESRSKQGHVVAANVVLMRGKQEVVLTVGDAKR